MLLSIRHEKNPHCTASFLSSPRDSPKNVLHFELESTWLLVDRKLDECQNPKQIQGRFLASHDD